MFHLFSSKHKNVTTILDTTLAKLNSKDPAMIQKITSLAQSDDPLVIESCRERIVAQCLNAKEHIACGFWDGHLTGEYYQKSSRFQSRS